MNSNFWLGLSVAFPIHLVVLSGITSREQSSLTKIQVRASLPGGRAPGVQASVSLADSLPEVFLFQFIKPVSHSCTSFTDFSQVLHAQNLPQAA